MLDFDFEKDRVVQAKDVFVPSKVRGRKLGQRTRTRVVDGALPGLQDARLLDLEREKARLEYIALRQETDSRRQERQRVEIAARKEWLRVSQSASRRAS